MKYKSLNLFMTLLVTGLITSYTESRASNQKQCSSDLLDVEINVDSTAQIFSIVGNYPDSPWLLALTDSLTPVVDAALRNKRQSQKFRQAYKIIVWAIAESDTTTRSNVYATSKHGDKPAWLLDIAQKIDSVVLRWKATLHEKAQNDMHYRLGASERIGTLKFEKRLLGASGFSGKEEECLLRDKLTATCLDARDSADVVITVHRFSNNEVDVHSQVLNNTKSSSTLAANLHVAVEEWHSLTNDFISVVVWNSNPFYHSHVVGAGSRTILATLLKREIKDWASERKLRHSARAALSGSTDGIGMFTNKPEALFTYGATTNHGLQNRLIATTYQFYGYNPDGTSARFVTGLGFRHLSSPTLAEDRENGGGTGSGMYATLGGWFPLWLDSHNWSRMAIMPTLSISRHYFDLSVFTGARIAGETYIGPSLGFYARGFSWIAVTPPHANHHRGVGIVRDQFKLGLAAAFGLHMPYAGKWQVTGEWSQVYRANHDSPTYDGRRWNYREQIIRVAILKLW